HDERGACVPRSRRAACRLDRQPAIGADAPVHGAARAGALSRRGARAGREDDDDERRGASVARDVARRAAVPAPGRVHRALGDRLGGHAPHRGPVHLLGEGPVTVALTFVSWLDLLASVLLAGGILFAVLIAAPSPLGVRILRSCAVVLGIVLLVDF